MPDDDRKRRRLGDETKGRIADLASGWDTPGPEVTGPAPDPRSPADASRRKPKTMPPPPPGSVGRRDLDDAIFELDEDDDEAASSSASSSANALDALDLDDNDATAPPPRTAPPARAKPTTAPPPVPGKSGARHAHKPSASRSGPSETGTVDVSGLIAEKTQPPELLVPIATVDASKALSKTPGPDVQARSGPVAARPGPPSPPPGARATGASPTRSTGASPTSPPPISAPDKSGPPRPPPGRAQRASIPVPDDSGAQVDPRAATQLASPGAKLAVPLGEFDASSPGLDQATVVKDPPAELLRSGGVAPAKPARDDSTGVTVEPATFPFERGDPTAGSDATEIHRPSAVGKAVTPRGRLRTIAQLQRRRGVGGDMRYVLTAIFGIRRVRRELVTLEAKQATQQQSRRRHLTTLGRTAITADGFHHPALGRAREQLATVEDERAQHTAQVSAADAELQRVKRDRDAKAKQYAEGIAAVDAELSGIAKKLEPLEKELAGVTRRAADLRDNLRRLDEKLAFTEASLAGVDNTDEDRARIQAEIAALKADRKAAQADEPTLASELDSLHPRIAALEASRADARRRRTELEQTEVEDQRRTEELLTAIGAKRKVLDRAAADAETLRDKIMFELGERLYVDRPDSMHNELAPIDAIDVELGTCDRRSMELREILQSVDRWKIVRGVGLWLLLLAALGGIAFVLFTYVL